MRERKLLSCVVLATFIFLSNGCDIVDHLWLIPISDISINDTFEVGEIVTRIATTNIEGVISVTYGEATLAGPYFDLSIENSELVVRTTAAFARYEEVEVESRVTITAEFSCTGGGTRGGLMIWVDINDTNNNAPEFIPTSEFEFIVTPPLPPGFLVTGCYNDVITVRDIDLTTYRIDFAIEDNPFFEIYYDEAATTVSKQFAAQLRTKTFVRSLNEPLTLTITATDVDLTLDPPLTATGLVRIVADSEFQFPEEPVFYQTFYLANYTDDHQLNLLETISLRQGFDEYVNFTLEGEYYEHFDVRTDNNQVTIVVRPSNPLPREVWLERQIILIVTAEREFTSGASTTVIVQLPEETELQFERVFYEGVISNNILDLAPLVLSQGSEGVTVSAVVVGEHESYFTASVEADLVTLTMTPLIDDVIDNNHFIALQVVATSEHSSASTVVNLEIIKEDSNTPVFDKSIYNGNYDPATGLIIEDIGFVQGFDNTVTVNLTGDYAGYFQIAEFGPVIAITSSSIPPEMFSQRNILITIEATKPRTVGANAAIHVALPAARELEFEDSTYRGSIEDGLLSLQPILLHQGFEEGVSFSLSGEYFTYFTARNEEGLVTIELPRPLPDTAISQNSVIMLTLTASGLNSITTTTSVLLDIIKEDTTTPVFSQPIYYGTYSGGEIEIEPINLARGFDGSVSFRIDGDHARYFAVSNDNVNNAVITLQLPIPEDVIFSEKVLIFNIFADKALTVGANAAVLIRFPSELTDLAIMRFSRHTYVGTLEEKEIHVDDIVLDTGFAPGTEFILSGDYADFFSWSSTNNVVQISNFTTLPDEVLEENDFIVLQMEARRPRAVSVWTSVVVDIVKQEVIAPVFGQAYYTGAYTEETGLTFEGTINLSEGYDETVTFALSGEAEAWFSLVQDGYSLTLISRLPVPAEILENNNQILFTVIAIKPTARSGRTVISLDLPKDFSDSSFRFQQDFYRGQLQNGNINLNEIVLQDYTSDVNYSYTGNYTNYFQLTNQEGTFTIELDTSIPNEVLEETNVFVFTLEAHNTVIRTHTVIIIENIRTQQEHQQIEFEKPYYIGSYSTVENLQFDFEIRLASETYQSVIFDLEGEDAAWFGLEPNGTSITLTLTSPIPAAVIANNQQLVFVVTAQSPSSTTARATVVISLVDSFPEGSAMLGFDHVTYLGSIENNQVTIPRITLTEGFTEGVEFTLHGELKSFFSLSSQGAIVTVTLNGDIPEELVPANRIIIIYIRASESQAVTAYATIVLESILNVDVQPVVELIFTQTFYGGSYAVATGLSFPTEISLSQGYDSNVEFALEGDDAVWFGLVTNDNSVTVTLTSPIPAAVIANNQQLVFVITARSPGSATARATVRISLLDSFPEGSAMLGFDRVTYLGSIENNQATIPTITLSEGFTEGVEFTLHGELESYFSLSSQGAIVSVTLNGDIPEELVPANRIIIIYIRASESQAVTAYATIVLESILNVDVQPVVELIFTQTFYGGSYAVATGLSFPTEISLSQGYDSNVEFALEGDDAVWFGLVTNDNSVTVTLTSPIPAAVIANNQQLVFVITARSPGSATARATVRISLLDSFPEGSAMLGFDRVTYLGSIENNQATIPTITLSEGFTEGVEFTLHGELESYFSLSSQGAIVSVTLNGDIPEELVPANRIIIIYIRASESQAVTAYATIVLESILNVDVQPVVELIFTQTFYGGSYAVATGLSFPTEISLSQGYDSNVEFALEGDDAVWFGLVTNDNSVTVTLTSPIPAAVIANNQQLVFVITARSPGSATARATVRISLLDSFPEGSAMLGFDRVTYLGSIENNQATIPTITLSEGFTEGVEFTLHGELESYFSLSSQGAIVSVTLNGDIPEELVPANRIIIIYIRASESQAVTAYATIVLESILNVDVQPVVELIFTQTFYGGSYAVATGLSFPTEISLSQGYDSNVEFALEGDDAVWFGLVTNDNSVTVTLTSPIPAAVIANNQQLVFVITARSPGSATARATVRISLLDSFPEGSAMLGFDRVTYLGSIENNQATIPTITLSEGFTEGVEFTLHGELESYFSLSSQGAIVSVTLNGDIPEELVPANRIIIIYIRASESQAVTAYATIVLESILNVDVQPVVELIFTQTFYGGSYDVATGLSFPTEISLSQGYDSNVEFALEGDDAVWFGLVTNDNSVTVTLTSPIPAAVIANNQQLVFVITARSPGSATARATVRISLLDSFPEGSAMLGFDRVTYLGSIENNQATIPTITLSEGFTEGVEFTLHGELESYFSLSSQGAIVSVTLNGDIPEELVPANRIIIIYIRASESQAVTAYATIVLESILNVDVQPVVELIFTQTFYGGSYAVATGLSFPTEISLSQGYDSNVEFALEGDDAVWFGLVTNDNSVTVTLTSPIPAAVIANNQQLVFVITARSPGSATARATVRISLLDSFPEGSAMLGFDRVTYLGSIENNQATIPTITLSEGFTEGVEFTLHGELESYFSLSSQGAIVSVTLNGDIPEELVPANRIIIIYIRASESQAVTAYATIVLESILNVDVQPVVELIFTQTFYGGSYAVATGLSFPTEISLSQGYDSNVEFALEGDDAVWFGLVTNDNSVTVTLTSPIPAAVIANNQQLVFVITARSPGSATARATVRISLLDSFPEGSAMLGFDRVTYLGSIENNQATIPTITLSEGFTEGVEFTLHGELESYFSLSSQGAIVSVTLNGDIPEELVPANRIIIIYIRASESQAVTAYATIVLESILNVDVQPVVELIFTQTFYGGSYAVATGLSFPTEISLSQGYDSNVEFALEGDDAVWFGLVTNDNSVTVTLTSPIPAAVIANNQQLVFVITARSPGSATARATVRISLLDSFPEGSAMLGFDRVTYLGSIENNQATIPTITLSEGFTEGVEFTLHGELESYFSLSSQGAIVSVTLNGDIPEELVPANRIIIIYIRASESQAVTAYATIVLESILNVDVQPVVELIFTQTFYGGSYDVATGLSFPTEISLSQGYDSNVEFALEGDDAVWFGLVTNDNSVTVTLTSPIPVAVIANNQQLVFVITARSPGSATARATVRISLLDSFPEGSAMLGFDRVTYLGSIENNQATIPTITLSEGFTEGVEFTLHGELESYFSLSSQGAIVSVTLNGDIPEELVPANRIIIIYIRASESQAVTAYATIVLESILNVDVQPVVELIFTQTFYGGSYAVATGLSFPTEISLSQGYDSNVEFALEGDDAVWFGLVTNDNSVTVTLTSPIPAAVIANNQQLVFVITARSPGSATARATVRISLLDSFPEGSAMLGFDRVTYLGSIENNQATIPTITLSEGFTEGVEFTLHGELESYFSLSSQGAIVSVTLNGDIPEELVPANRIIIIYIRASESQAVTAYATIVLESILNVDVQPVVELIFTQTFYGGSYAVATGLSFPTEISLSQGYDSNVEFALEGDDAVWFGLVTNDNSVTVTLTSPIPAAVIANNQQLVFVITARSPGSATARATVRISLLDSFPEGSAMLGFDRVTYLGSIENNQATIPTITLSEGFTEGVEFTLHGELESYFSLSSQGAIVSVTLNGDIPEELVPANRIIIIYIRASESQAVTAYATIVLESILNVDVQPVVELIFTQTFYGGSYAVATGLSFPTEISLSQGYDSNVEFALEGDDAVWFGLVTNDNSVTVTLTSPIPAAVIANNQQLVFVITARSPGSATARATVRISLLDSFPEGSAMLGFDRVTYLGSIENNQATIPTITLSEGFTEGVEFTLHGELESYFSLSSQGAIVSVTLNGDIPEELVPANRIIIIYIRASESQAVTAYATIVLESILNVDVQPVVELIFTQTFYGGSYAVATGLSFPTEISLSQGYDSNVEFALEGDDAVWFGLVTNDNLVTVTLTSPIPAAVIANNQQLVFVVTARSLGSATARATVRISLVDYLQPGSDVTFEKVLYEGFVHNTVVNHETISIIGFSDSTIELHGEYSSSFVAELSNGRVIVSTSSSITLPSDVTHVVLELRAGSASAVLVLNVVQTDGLPAPTVSFTSPSYAVRVDISHTGMVGQVLASADNGEDVSYSLRLDNAHLQERLSVNGEGELHLSAPLNTGFYTFEVEATTVFTQVRGTALVHLSVEVVTVCGDDFVMPPLIILDVDEEEPHYDLINGTQYDNCHFTLTNRWPLDQSWVYVDEAGLHTTAIDREHESIAFMTVSQVQVEVILHCEGDLTRIKRSLSSDALGPYDYGSNKWILTDTILFNSRRSLMNIIVNDINDNAPIFVGKENEPIAVGYPVPELAERVLPRSLAQLQATDADIGENAALAYWSSAPQLAVAPTTGFVHLRNGAILENGARLTVSATDRNGDADGLTGSIDILVRLLDESYIAVVTIRDAFLDDEETVLSSLSEAIGYEVRVLRSVVISDEVEMESSRKADVTSAAGASLQLYVYGLIARELVSVEQLMADISNIVTAPVIIASSVSLQDHLEGQEICVTAGRDTGLLVATIVLSVLLFIVLVLIAVWFFLRWRKNRNYDEFSDENSLASRNVSEDKFPKPELPKPRLDIAELKKSERRLQEMLDAPIQEISVQPTSSRNDAILDMPEPMTPSSRNDAILKMPEPMTPMVIQSIDKLKDAADESSDDEFGEIKTPRRKSVVTFNENVEKIIHLEDTPDAEDLSEDPDYEVYKL